MIYTISICQASGLYSSGIPDHDNFFNFPIFFYFILFNLFIYLFIVQKIYFIMFYNVREWEYIYIYIYIYINFII